MKIITIGNTKGGVGKSTIAANLSVAAAMDGKRVLLVDADEQKSSLDFRNIRGADNVKAISIPTPTLHKDINAFTKSYDIVVIDVGGKNSDTFRSAIVAAGKDGLFLVPCLPSTYDIWSTILALQLLQEVRTISHNEVKARLLVNQMQSNTIMGREAEESLESLAAEYECPVLTTRLHFRAAYKTAIMNGLGVMEHEPKGKAATEFKALYDEVMAVMSSKTKGGKR